MEDLLKLLREELVLRIELENVLDVANKFSNPAFRTVADFKDKQVKDRQKKIADYKLPKPIVDVAMQLFGNCKDYEEAEYVAKKRTQLNYYKEILGNADRLLSEEIVFGNCTGCMHFDRVNFDQFDSESHIVGEFDKTAKPYCRQYDRPVEERVEGLVRDPCLEFEPKDNQNDEEIESRNRNVVIGRRIVAQLEKELENYPLKVLKKRSKNP